MPLARSTGPLISAVEGVFFPMIAATSARRPHITCVVTRTVLYKLAGRTLSVPEFLEVFGSHRDMIERLASNVYDRKRAQPPFVVTVGLHDLHQECADEHEEDLVGAPPPPRH
jgi:hypothetical protein